MSKSKRFKCLGEPRPRKKEAGRERFSKFGEAFRVCGARRLPLVALVPCALLTWRLLPPHPGPGCTQGIEPRVSTSPRPPRPESQERPAWDDTGTRSLRLEAQVLRPPAHSGESQFSLLINGSLLRSLFALTSGLWLSVNSWPTPAQCSGFGVGLRREKARTQALGLVSTGDVGVFWGLRALCFECSLQASPRPKGDPRQS